MRSFFYAGYPFCKQNHTLMAKKSYTYCNKIIHLLQKNHTLMAKIIHLWQKSYTYGKNHQKSLRIPQKCCTFAPKLELCHYYIITMKLVCD